MVQMTEGLRIAVVTSEFPISAEPYRGIPIYQTVLALQRLAEIEIFCPISCYSRWGYLQPKTFYFRRVPPGYTPPGTRTHYVEYPAMPFVSRPLNGRTSAGRLLPLVRRFQPDMILSYWIYPDGYASVRMGEELGIPVVVGSRGFDLGRITDPFTYWLTRKTLHRASRVLTVSEDLRERALSFGIAPERVRTIHNGCDRGIFHVADPAAARAELGVPTDSRLILFVGRLDRLKGVQELLEAFVQLRRRNQLLELALIGEGSLEQELRSRCAQMNATEHVRFLGTRKPPEVARWLAAADLLCLPSYSEGCPNVILEALACGRPVVATNVGGIPEIVDTRCAVLVPPQDAALLEHALAQALECSWDARAIAASFGRSWDDVARETYEVCCAALKRSSGASEGSGRRRAPVEMCGEAESDLKLPDCSPKPGSGRTHIALSRYSLWPGARSHS